MGQAHDDGDPRDTLPVHVARAILAGAAHHGLDAEAFAARVGVRPAQLADPDARLPAAALVRLWREVSEASGEADFGLLLGERAGTGALHLAGLLLASSATLGDGLRRVMRFFRVVNDAQRVAWAETAEAASSWFTVRELPYDLPRHATEFAFAWSITTTRAITGVAVDPLFVSFEHPAPARREHHDRIFRCPVRFGAARSEMAFAPAVLGLPVTTHDPALAEMLEAHARNVLARLPPRSGYVDRAREAVAASLASGAGLDDVARALRCHPRSLQRRLRDEGTSFAQLVDEVRRELALEALRDPSRALAEVAFALGFSDQSAFHKAFVRWTGERPGAWRRRAG